VEAGLTDDVIRDQMLTMLIAGHDTSTALLGQHPNIQARVVREVDTMDKSALLDKVIKESLRLYPPIHIGNRQVTEEIKFNDGRDSVPAGERMFYSIYLTHRDPSIWENAEIFCPERFTHGRKTPPLPMSRLAAVHGRASVRLLAWQRRAS
jgi:cytochrome P450